MPQLAVSLTTFIAELTPERASRLKSGVLPQLDELAQILVTLDLMNSDEARPFDLRPNPQFDIFGDTCHDVLFRRLRAAEAFLAKQSTAAEPKSTTQLPEDDSPV